MEWQQLKDPSGRTYYFNSVTSESKWEKPESLMTDFEKVLLKFNLKQFERNGSVYYYNELTKESLWEIPEAVNKEIERLKVTRENEEEEEEDKTNIQEQNITNITTEEPLKEKEHVTDQATESEVQVPKEVKLETYHKRSNLLNLHTNNTDPSPLHQMFKDHKVDATWSFNQIISTCSSDPRYWSNSMTPSQKKTVFEEYLKSRTKEELMRENTSIEKFQKAFVSLLGTMDIKYYTRWRTVNAKLINEPVYNLYFISESVKKKTFLEYRETIVKEHEDKENELINKAKSELVEYFKGLTITADTTWEELLVTIANDESFKKNKHFAKLNQLDLLSIYQDKLRSIRTSITEQTSEQEAVNYRHDRRARDSFVELLKSLHEEGILTADIKWADLYDFIQDDERYLGMIGRHGSTPTILFDEFVKQESLIINSLRGRVEGLLIDKEFKIKEDSEEQQEQFMKLTSELKDNEQDTAEVNESRLKIIYEKLLKQHAADQIEARNTLFKSINASIQDFITEQFDRLRTSHENVNALTKDEVTFPDFFKEIPTEKNFKISKGVNGLKYTSNDEIFKHLKLELMKDKSMREAQERNNKKRALESAEGQGQAKRMDLHAAMPIASDEMDY
ncbi:hypothetical protein WICPIJ_006905 [Wickerhamomyces pijperi]|uniref:Pre-mRNA-processing protein PRP40 n=1 Tax=Wickerhamomyces pijperi TaxID=599730 RepID=A0A9P8Q1H4_WICPI|nr:hypothetical protein WICPIJ_006905 [Wickerhamomyces pijperi]